MSRGAVALLSLASLVASARAQEPRDGAGTILTVRQSGPADLVGSDDVVLKAACDRLRTRGGTLVLGPGRYVVRRSLLLPANLVLRGEPGAVLALPSPSLTAADAPAGARELVLAGAHEFVASAVVQILPPVGSAFFSDGHTRALELQVVEKVEGPTLRLHAPLALTVPAGSRVGYPHKLLQVHQDGLATIESLAFEGGRVEALPMPGHSQRCALWASAPFGFEEARKGPPGRGVTVRHCRFSDWYGRGVALYHQVDGLVEGCLFERIADEAIDLDHFVERFRIVGNEVRDAAWGIVLNDASRNVVEYNRIQGGEIGIWSWWYDKTPRQGINEENVIRHNFVRGTRAAPIHVDRTCVRYTIEHNWVEGEIVVVEPENNVRENTRLDAPRDPPR
jgi:hypothetical protein